MKSQEKMDETMMLMGGKKRGLKMEEGSEVQGLGKEGGKISQYNLIQMIR